MSLTLQDAVAELYRIAKLEGKRTSTVRLRKLAEYCAQELASRRMAGAQREQVVAGAARPKNWDVTWSYGGKVRLAISLKSILENLPGTVPNRGDDLIGEVANAQLASPEIVIGYIIIVDVTSDVLSATHGATWTDVLEHRLGAIAGRQAPHWTIGTLEAYALIRVNFSEGANLVPPLPRLDAFFDALANQVGARNPNALGSTPTISVVTPPKPRSKGRP